MEQRSGGQEDAPVARVARGEVRERLVENGAKMVRTCVLLTKDKERAEEVEADYSGFDIGDEFVVGYGLDFRGRYRNLPYIGVLKEEVIGS